ncbi:hypothetical protein ACFVSU_10735 [Microbacterium sp. NPDC058062]|uniref:hypothetical protein n=1 Tax=Microbacterium sp. NPDC058062 TaxID=3346320 RepID=UPI0036D84EFE
MTTNRLPVSGQPQVDARRLLRDPGEVQRERVGVDDDAASTFQGAVNGSTGLP